MSRRSNEIRMARSVGSRLNERRWWRVEFFAVLGNGAGQVEMVPGVPHLVWVTREERGVIGNVLNYRVANIDGLPVFVGYTDEFPNTLQVLSYGGVGVGVYDTGGDSPSTPPPTYVPSHHTQHEFRTDGTGGDDVVWIAIQQITDGLTTPTYPTRSMSVEVYECWYTYLRSQVYFAGATSADLSGYVPASAAHARWVLISIDAATNTLQYTPGNTFPIALRPPDVDYEIPQAPFGSVPLSGVYMSGGMTEIGWDDLYDLRSFPTGVGGVAAPGPHELMYDDYHSDVDGDTDPTRGDVIVANYLGLWNVLALGAVGEVLTSDGSDVSWQPTGVGVSYWEPLANGNGANPSLVFTGDGDVIMVEVML